MKRAAFALCLLLSPSLAQAQDANALRARYQTLHEQLRNNQFQRPLYVESSQTADTLRGDIYARIEQPASVAGPALRGGDHWCDILILHINVKGCRATVAPAGIANEERLILYIGRKFDQPLAAAHRFEFNYRVVADSPSYQHVVLDAAQGPLGTSNYRIQLELVGLDTRRSFLHLSYSYVYSMTASLGMRGYLATIGRDKVGFSIVERKANGQPVYQDGMRGVVERNTMRYYLAIEAYLGTLSTPAAEQLDKRLNDWHTGVERYSMQLHELERDEYLAMKHNEIKRQQDIHR